MKLHLTIESGSLAGQKFDLESGFLTIGRGETCSVRFDPMSERVASKQHAFIEAKADGYYVTDNQSTNGTLLNGTPITSSKLSNGDRIQFGKNGVFGDVLIEMEGQISAIPRESYRDLQVENFNQLAATGPVNIQNSISNLGLGHIPTATAENKTGKYVGIGVTIFAIAFMMLIVAAIMFLSVGPVAAVIASVVAFVPAMLYLVPLIWLDRYDPEPLWLLALAFAWGALVAVLVSFVINTFFGIAVGIAVSPEAGQAVGAVLSAPIFEEGSKGLGLVLLLIFFRKYFDDILDGIVFAGVIALGFATVENVLYYGRALAGGGFGALALIFFLRGILSPFAHVSFTAMTGIGCGIARESHNKAVRILLPLVGYIGAVILHAIWNGMAVIGGFEGFLLGYLIIEIPFFLIFVGFSLYIMSRQNRILREMLAIDIARGLISTELGDTVTSAFKSSGWLIAGLFNGKFRARSNYLRSVGKLGLSYWHIQRATAAQGQTGSFQQNPILREEVLKWRDKV
ncbi:MAG: PrsW family intramembrane metalloprotease [Pyrinomonadaceae bacterium]|nr:PrsW family intramembrane metalloprotease [Pyrinomonadaceae bacterium]MBP6213518.1 PrsW family intramembrane metalloprotease [Pyrinomonadaceae bacterium]